MDHMLSCSICGTESRIGHLFCGRCGAPLDSGGQLKSFDYETAREISEAIRKLLNDARGNVEEHLEEVIRSLNDALQILRYYEIDSAPPNKLFAPEREQRTVTISESGNRSVSKVVIVGSPDPVQLRHIRDTATFFGKDLDKDKKLEKATTLKTLLQEEGKVDMTSWIAEHTGLHKNVIFEVWWCLPFVGLALAWLVGNTRNEKATIALLYFIVGVVLAVAIKILVDGMRASAFAKWKRKRMQRWENARKGEGSSS